MSSAVRKGVVALDFDGCIAYGANVKIRFAKQTWGLELAVEQTAEDAFPLGPQSYRQMMDVVGRNTDEYELAPDCGEVCERLRENGFGLVVVTSRADYELGAAKYFIEKHRLPLTDVRNTHRQSKRAICQELGASACLEDSLWKLVELEGMNIALYFINQEWNRHEHAEASKLEYVVPVKNWQHFYSHITGTDLAADGVVKNGQPSR